MILVCGDDVAQEWPIGIPLAILRYDGCCPDWAREWSTMTDNADRAVWRLLVSMVLTIALMNMLRDILTRVLPAYSWPVQAIVSAAMVTAGILILRRFLRTVRPNGLISWSAWGQVVLVVALALSPVMYVLRRLGIAVELIVVGTGLVAGITWAVLRDRKARTGQGG